MLKIRSLCGLIQELRASSEPPGTEHHRCDNFEGPPSKVFGPRGDACSSRSLSAQLSGLNLYVRSDAKGKVFRCAAESRWICVCSIHSDFWHADCCRDVEALGNVGSSGVRMRKVSNSQINTQQHCREPFRYFALAACRSKERAEIPKRPVYGCVAWQEMTPKTPKAHQCPKA